LKLKKLLRVYNLKGELMRLKQLLLTAIFLCLIWVNPIQANDLDIIAKKVTSENATEVATAISDLRKAGPNGLESLMKTFAPEIKKHLESTTPEIDPNWQKISQALNAVSRQKDAYASGLYWYTDLEDAKVAAKASKKPILSLRLLGNLDDELSCANSRFFRTILYPNTKISKYLQENYILHWKSVRPAPKLTIDFGDGRKLERTITGNSIHYILDSQGQLVDALPGLHSPAAFLAWLTKVKDFTKQIDLITGDNKESIQKSYLQQYHRNSIMITGSLLTSDLEKIQEKNVLNVLLLGDPNKKITPKASEAAPVAITKAIVELPILRQMADNLDDFKALTNDATWNKLANLHIAEVRLDQNTIDLMISKNITAYKQVINGQDPMQKVLEKLTFSIAKDSVYNEYFLHSKIHQLLLNADNYKDLEAFNEKIYSELFLTPKSDPWLGLKPDDVYSAIENDGVVR
jgi:hypothetical protein